MFILLVELRLKSFAYASSASKRAILFGYSLYLFVMMNELFFKIKMFVGV